MKTAEIKELSTKELLERIEAEAVALNRMEINHSIPPWIILRKLKLSAGRSRE